MRAIWPSAPRLTESRSSAKGGRGKPKVVRDGKRSTIEDRIGDLPAQMLKAIDAARRKKAEWEAEERRREAERQAKWEAEERAKEAARLAAAKKKREIALFKRGRLWKRCGDLRQEAAEWIEWATGVDAHVAGGLARSSGPRWSRGACRRADVARCPGGRAVRPVSVGGMSGFSPGPGCGRRFGSGGIAGPNR